MALCGFCAYYSLLWGIHSLRNKNFLTPNSPKTPNPSPLKYFFNVKGSEMAKITLDSPIRTSLDIGSKYSLLWSVGLFLYGNYDHNNALKMPFGKIMLCMLVLRKQLHAYAFFLLNSPCVCVWACLCVLVVVSLRLLMKLVASSVEPIPVLGINIAVQLKTSRTFNYSIQINQRSHIVS